MLLHSEKESRGKKGTLKIKVKWNELKNAAEENPKGYSKSKEGVPEDVSVSVYGHKYSCVITSKVTWSYYDS